MRPLFLILVAARLATAQAGSLDVGIAHLNARRLAEAHVFFDAATRAQPRNAEAALWYGKTLMGEGKPGDAEGWFNKAAALEPQRSEHQLWIARATGLQAQRASKLRQPFLAHRMKSAVDKAIELDGNNIDARELRYQYFVMAPAVLGGGADKARRELAEIEKRNRYRAHLLQAQHASRARDSVAVERQVRTLLSDYPDSVTAVGLFASWAAETKRVGEAWSAVDALVKRRPQEPAALFQVGRIAAVTGQQLDRGEDALRRVLAMAPAPGAGVPTVGAIQYRLGQIAQRRGDRAAARAAFETAARLEPTNPTFKRALDGLK